MPADTGPYFAANLLALSRRSAALAAAVRSCAPDPSLRFLAARDGSVVPAAHDGSRPVALHSLYDPAREGRRLLASQGDAGCLVFFGLGGGYLVTAALENQEVCAIIVIERGVQTIRALMERIPLAPLIEDARVQLLAGTGEIRTVVPAAWQPALMGGMRTVPLVPWCAVHGDFHAEAARETNAAVEAVRADYGVQAHFGKRWFANMLWNMPAAERQGRDVPRRSRASVTAAGPSLEGQLARLAEGRDGGMVIAADTSLPALLQAGITPDAVLSIDCQSHGYHHFFRGVPEGTTLFLDLASPPQLSRLTRRTFFVAGTHPFAAYLSARWMDIPRIDMSGGNVTHAALSLARGLGAREITLFGADFSYPRGRSYCRGTYIHELFHSRYCRVVPVESSFFAFLFRDPRTSGEPFLGGRRYTTPLLDGYRENLLRLMGQLDAECTAVPGEGLPLDHPPAPAMRVAAPLHWRPPRCGWKEILIDLADQLRTLPGLGPSRWAALSTLSLAQREVLNILLPIAASVERESGPGYPRISALEQARQWAITRLERVLTR
jgi:hypothetical protein